MSSDFKKWIRYILYFILWFLTVFFIAKSNSFLVIILGWFYIIFLLRITFDKSNMSRYAHYIFGAIFTFLSFPMSLINICEASGRDCSFMLFEFIFGYLILISILIAWGLYTKTKSKKIFEEKTAIFLGRSPIVIMYILSKIVVFITFLLLPIFMSLFVFFNKIFT